MPVQIIPLDFSKPQDPWLSVYYNHKISQGIYQDQVYHEFIEIKKLESTLELQWHFLIIKHDAPIGSLVINNTYLQPEPLYFLMHGQPQIQSEFIQIGISMNPTDYSQRLTLMLANTLSVSNPSYELPVILRQREM